MQKYFGVNLIGCYEVQYVGSTTKCADKLCMTNISEGDKIFLDTINENTYCHQCGQCLRYARKKAAERGEPIGDVEL